MQFNPGDGTGIVDEMNDICGSDNVSFTLKSKARRFNSALDRFFTIAFRSARSGSVDDTNQTTPPVESINLVSGTQRYALDSFSSELNNLLRFEVTDSNGKATALTRLDRDKITTALTEYKSTDGVPEEYDIIGKYLYLYPAPSYSASSALKAYFDRNKSAFASTDTTKSPGVPSAFHPYLCRRASLPYLIDKQRPRGDIAALIAQDETEIERHYASKEKSVNRGMRPMPQDNK